MKDRSVGIIPFRVTSLCREYLVICQDRGHWGFPKGHPVKGETDEAAARRELKEETGLDGCYLCPDFQELMRYQFESGDGSLVEKEVVLLLGRIESGVAIPHPDEVKEVRWLDYEGAKATLTYENSRSVLVKAEVYLRNTDR